ncbi:MAG: SlyX family protein [Desulfuromonadales bacterium]|nr:SlyX family protein [Desulfuromonadales bacterium]
MDKMKERLMELEIRYTHQAQLIEELNEVLTDACARIARLEQENRTLREQLGQMAPDDFTLSPDE